MPVGQLRASSATSAGQTDDNNVHRVATHRKPKAVAKLGATRVMPPSRHAQASQTSELPPSRAELAFSADPLVTGIGTHYAFIWVGTPPQRQSVIIDTGSYHTAFPCDPCGDCGDYTAYHEGLPFEPAASSTLVVTGDSWSASYSEGDGWHAAVVKDEAFVGGKALTDVPGASRLSLPLNLGCMDQV